MAYMHALTAAATVAFAAPATAAAANQENGGQRVATVLMYLSNVEEGKACIRLARES